MMRSEAIPSARIDVCDTCGGVWVDWFDGEVHSLAVEAEEARRARGERRSALHAGSLVTGTCPRCLVPLHAELRAFADASESELVRGVELFRCSECAGCFVPRPSAHLLLDRALEPRGGTAWEVLVARLKGMFDDIFS
jgi:Zn-finger nucleic acid-binding protein